MAMMELFFFPRTELSLAGYEAANGIFACTQSMAEAVPALLSALEYALS
jgi:hypothetical protein